jgi:hypothetical protein
MALVNAHSHESVYVCARYCLSEGQCCYANGAAIPNPARLERPRPEESAGLHFLELTCIQVCSNWRFALWPPAVSVDHVAHGHAEAVMAEGMPVGDQAVLAALARRTATSTPRAWT